MATERMLKRNDKTCYRVVIHSLRERMNCRPGQEIRLTSFTVNDVKFRLQVFPNGDSIRNEGNISVFLVNESEETVQVDFKLTQDERDKHFKDTILAPGKERGLNIFAHENSPRFRRYTDEEFDEELEVFCTVYKVWKNHTETSANSLVESVEGKPLRNELKRRLNDLEITLNLKFMALDVMLKRMFQSVETSTLNNNMIRPICPGCFESFVPGAKIAQCNLGHFICWDCWKPNSMCRTCSNPVIGRAEGMEKYLKSLFQFQPFMQFDLDQPLVSTPKRIKLDTK